MNLAAFTELKMSHLPYQLQASASTPLPSLTMPSRPNKVALQREYREKEADCFNRLRDVIHRITGVVPQTRHEILHKAIDLLSRTPGLGEPEAAYSALLEPSPVDVHSTMPGHMGYSQPPMSWPHPQQPGVASSSSAPTADYVFPSYDPFYGIMSLTDPALDQPHPTYPGYGGGWPPHY